MGPGVLVSRTMTVVEADDGVVVMNPVRLSDAGQAELDRLGPVKHLVKLSDSHSIDEPFYIDRYEPTFWAFAEADLGDLSAGRTLGPDGPIAGGVVIDYGPTAGWREGAYLVPADGGTLVTCDAIQNCADSEGASALGKIMTSVMGFKGGVIVPPMWTRFQKLKRPAGRRHARTAGCARVREPRHGTRPRHRGRRQRTGARRAAAIRGVNSGRFLRPDTDG